MVDVTDETFETAVIEESKKRPVVVDLWADWCGPCKTLGPIIEKVCDETDGKVLLAKVDVEANPQTSAAFRVQSIPAVYALKDGQVVDGFMGAQGEDEVRAFVQRLLPTDNESIIETLIAKGDEASLSEILQVDPGHAVAVPMLAKIYVDSGRTDAALELLARIPETEETRQIAALARTGANEGSEVEVRLAELLPSVKDDEEARQEFVDLLEVLGAEHPATGTWRKKLTNQLF